ncbi:hypothetical protein [Yersinia phage vB_YenS-P840]|nr:hypothetical protein [Yersinia phage vB_YenS-P840]
MDIKLVGGPYDGDWVTGISELNTDYHHHPRYFIYLSGEIEPIFTPVNAGCDAQKIADIFPYKLERVYKTNIIWHYEYHYQGR